MASYRYKNINGAHTTVVSTTPCKLHSIVINTTSSAAITVYDNASGADANAIVALFPSSAVCGTYTYNVDLNKGCVIVTAGTGDITVTVGTQGN